MSIQTRVRDLNERSIDELMQEDDNSFCWAAGKINEAIVDMTTPTKKPGSRSPALTLKLDHKTKGAKRFEFSSDDDARDALDLLGDALGNTLKVAVRWDKASKRFVRK